ncbi:hypothetical protein BDQ12DRAFT_609076 [Crucibulum laeve]|uniref:Pentacotripeptide-repeat region of PRORP domain-containing protein n=1 Tax=Crucibulum laeve TaxID=68775 RepID=A0A5C3LVH7_9AGAR|nr:hypothetical protein BDQ12DRAFT_609076 [Crucibulum laeve]
MFSRILNNDPEAVIRLYTRFMDGLGGQEVWADVVDEESGAGNNSSADGLHHNRIPFIPGRVSILLSVITAHAMQNTFTDALRTSLESVIRFHPYTTTKFLNSLGNDPVLKGKVREYVQKLDLARMIARPPSFSKEITNLAHSRNTTRLEKLYEDVLHGLTGPGAYLAANPSLATTSRSVALTEVGWTSFLVAFLKCDRQDLAAKLWDDMGRLGLKPSVSMWTALLDAYGSAKNFDKALGAWRMMKAQGIQPDALTYRAMISNLFNASRKEEAMSYFREFQIHSMASASDAHRLSVYNTTLRGLLRGQHIKEVELLIQEMDAKGPAPDLVSYNTLLAYHARRSDFRALAAIVNRMTAVGITGDVFSFSTILSALLKVGKKDAPTMILKLMDKQGVQPSVATYTAIIDHLMREKSEQHVRAAFDMLHSMEQHSKVKPNDVTYTAILGGLYRGAWLAPEKAAAWRERAMTQIQARGIVFGLPTYHILLRTSFDYPREEGLDTALAYYTEMKRLKIKFVDTTWYILLAGLLQRGEWEVAEEVVQDMYASGVVPGGSLLGLVEKIRTRE